MVKLLERDEPMPRLFQHYENALAALCRGESENVALRKFERELMTELGVGLVLNRDSHGRHLDPNAWYRYRSGAGPMRVPESAAGTPGCVSGRSLLAFARDELNDARVLRDARTITRQAVEEQLGGRPLRSRELLPVPLQACPRTAIRNLGNGTDP
jgi:DNA repair protein RecO (recombination protein O)